MLLPSSPNRVFVDASSSSQSWYRSLGTDYISVFGTATAYTGWTYTGTPSLIANASDGDFLSLTDHNPPGLRLATIASAQSLRLQRLMFGSRAHMKAAADVLGYEPSRLCFRAIAQFEVASANEAQTGFGLVTTISATSTNAQKVAWISSDSANFVVRSDTNTDTGAAVDTNWHDWLVVLDGSNIEWFIDGASQGTCALQTDAYGCAFQVNGASSRTNIPAISTLHVWYE